LDIIAHRKGKLHMRLSGVRLVDAEIQRLERGFERGFNKIGVKFGKMRLRLRVAVCAVEKEWELVYVCRCKAIFC